jgi:hypothetical protein
VAEVVLAGISGMAERLNLFDLLAPNLINVVVECQCNSSIFLNNLKWIGRDGMSDYKFVWEYSGSAELRADVIL